MPISLNIIDSPARGSAATASPKFTRPDWAAGGKLRFHMMVKPAGAACNLDCTYCFYLHKEQLLDQPRQPRMSDEVLEQHIRQYIEVQEGDQVVFSWQGGEPTLMGLEFFRRVVELQARHKKPFQRVENDLQTNGTLLNDEWCRFLRQHSFLVGLSIDGPRALHDIYRVNKGGAPTFDSVLGAAKLLKKHGVPFNVLCVVNRENARRPLDVYRFLARELGTYRVQFTPCVEPREFKKTAPFHWNPAQLPMVGSPGARPGTPESIVTDWSVDPEDWGEFLCRVWDEWFQRDYGRIHVNLFETAVAQSMGLQAQTCTQAEICGKGLALEHNGEVYSCDHFVYPEFRLGNIATQHEGNMVLSERQADFGFAKRDTLPQYCLRCPHLKLCWGECPKNRIVRTPDGETGLNYLCPGWKKFYAHIQKDMPEILRRVRGLGQ
jgi:uncharacterized protein